MYGDDPIMKVLWEQIRDHGHLYPVTTKTAEIEKIMGQGCQAALLGQISPQKALADMEEKVNAALAT
jgi:maltose-binding protein MalE